MKTATTSNFPSTPLYIDWVVGQAALRFKKWQGQTWRKRMKKTKKMSNIADLALKVLRQQGQPLVM
jgi:hypothetical protein